MFKYILAATLLSLSPFSFEASATVTDLYSVVQDNITVKVAPKSGLPKASCKFYDKHGDRVAAQNVTVYEQFDNVTVIEANLYFEQHIKVNSIKCK